mmetsp:Transcript_35089/g.69138  ORF Transcript_35089/g.69138 Transcript_35089/m.69138 type:complete len:111 (-) Transcript_35089:274-606(-)|eukprot:CAMPEP_0194311502 /NCGR_PEP_ID=MMETSP0171-20130528/8426_1 /TAXON_ID=218684 /ORGANISM="Corethron pennatum, Strain L29A3" /LENGTH=110 /DNA_ID=CAMNT_0039065591 /DNA_START=100 /DNA_END=432 /DNA_ORIENTATION=-
MNQFVQRIANYVANEIVIKGLAESRTFQRFALRTHENVQKVKKDQLRGMESLREEVDKVLDEAAKGTLSSKTGSGGGGGASAKAAPPVPPLGGPLGFMSAFAKEVKKDFS